MEFSFWCGKWGGTVKNVFGTGDMYTEAVFYLFIPILRAMKKKSICRANKELFYYANFSSSGWLQLVFIWC